MAQKRYDDSRNWYAITTLAGYEDKVAENLRQRIQGVDMADKIFDTLVPKEKQIEVKNGKRKVVERKILQSYVLVEMKLTEETWFVVRNTPGVTGFIGSDSPTPVSEKEMREIRAEWALKSQCLISTSLRVKSLTLSTDLSKVSKVQFLKLMP